MNLVKGLYKKHIYCLTLVAILVGAVLGIVLNYRLSIMCVLFLVLYIGDNLLARAHVDVDRIYIFFFMVLFSFSGIDLAITQSDTELVRYVKDYCNLAMLDFIIFLFFLRILREKINHKKKDYIFILLILFFAFNVLSLIQSSNMSATAWTCIRCLKLLVIFIYFKYCFDFSKHKTSLYMGCFVGIIIQFLISIAQYIKKDVLGLSFLGEVETLQQRGVDGTNTIRPSGTFEHPSNLAFFAFIVFVFFLFDKSIEKRLRIITIGASLGIIYMAGARTIMVLTALAALFWFKKIGISLKNNRLTVILGIVAVACLLFFTSAFESIVNVFTRSDWLKQVANRTTQWSMLMDYIVKKPILGYGANTYTDITAPLISATMDVDTKFYLSNPCHNVYLQLWFDLGIGGVVVYILILIGGIKRYIKSKCKLLSQYGALFNSCFVFICALAVYNFVGWTGLRDETNFILFMMLGLLSTERVPFAER